MKKQSNEKPEGLKKPNYSPDKKNLERMAQVFNAWAERYAENPSEFSDVLDSDGNPVSDYGDSCAIYYDKLSRELEI
jgi:hypothetical protein